MERALADRNDDRLAAFSRRVDERFDHFDRRFEDVDKCFEQVDRRFDRVERHIEAQGEHFDARFDRLDARFEGMEARFNARLDALQRTMIISMTSIVLAFAAQIVFGN